MPLHLRLNAFREKLIGLRGRLRRCRGLASGSLSYLRFSSFGSSVGGTVVDFHVTSSVDRGGLTTRVFVRRRRVRHCRRSSCLDTDFRHVLRLLRTLRVHVVLQGSFGGSTFGTAPTGI